MNLTRRVARGVKTTFAASLASALIQAAIMVVMVRLVAADDYGAYAIAMVVASLSTWFTSSALERSLVTIGDKNHLIGRAVPVGLVVVASGAAAMAVVTLLDFSGLLRLPLGPTAMMLGAQALAGFSVVPRVLLRSRLRFGWIVSGELLAQVLGAGLIGIGLAAAGWGVYAVTMAAVATSAIVLLVQTMITPRTSYWPIRWQGNRQVLRDGLRTSQTNFVEVVNGQIPAILIGLLGQATLGVFNRAANLVQLPVQMVVTSVNRVFISALVTVGSDREKHRRAARLLTQVIAIVSTPVTFGIAGASREFTLVVMGAEWAAAIPVLPFLTVSTWSVVTAQAFATIIEAARRFEAKARLQLVVGVVLAAGVGFGATTGLVGATAGLALGGVALLALLGWYTARMMELPVRTVAGWLRPGLVAGMLCLGWSLALSAYAPLPPWLVFVLQIAGCGVLAGGYLLGFERALLREILGALRR